MLALASGSGSPSLSPTLIVIIIAAVILAVFWQAVLRIGIAALVIGFMFLLVSGVLDILHTLRGLFP